MAWTVLVLAVALIGAAWSFRMYVRFANDMLRTPKFAWTQTPGALWIALCCWTLVLLFGLNGVEWLFPTTSFARGDAYRIGRYALGISLYTIAPFTIPLMMLCAVGAVVQIGLDRFRAAWRSLVLLAVPPAIGFASGTLFSVFPHAISISD